MKQSPEFFQEPVAAATSAVAATRVRGDRRVGLGRWRGRLIGACEPGRRHQQESSIHEKFLRLGTQPRLRAAAAVAGDFLLWKLPARALRMGRSFFAFSRLGLLPCRPHLL